MIELDSQQAKGFVRYKFVFRTIFTWLLDRIWFFFLLLTLARRGGAAFFQGKFEEAQKDYERGTFYLFDPHLLFLLFSFLLRFPNSSLPTRMFLPFAYSFFSYLLANVLAEVLLHKSSKNDAVRKLEANLQKYQKATKEKLEETK